MANRAEGTTGLLQDFLLEAYGNVVQDDVSLSETGEPQGDGLIQFLHAEFGEVCESGDSTEQKLETLRKVVEDAINDLQALQGRLYNNVSKKVKRTIASEKTVSRISEAMTDGDADPQPNKAAGPAPL